MAIKDSNCRIMITISKKQKKWLDEQCKILDKTQSQFIRWIISRKAQEISEYLYMQTDIAQADLEKLIEIVKTPWLKEK